MNEMKLCCNWYCNCWCPGMRAKGYQQVWTFAVVDIYSNSSSECLLMIQNIEVGHGPSQCVIMTSTQERMFQCVPVRCSGLQCNCFTTIGLSKNEKNCVSVSECVCVCARACVCVCVCVWVCVYVRMSLSGKAYNRQPIERKWLIWIVYLLGLCGLLLMSFCKKNQKYCEWANTKSQHSRLNKLIQLIPIRPKALRLIRLSIVLSEGAHRQWSWIL